LASFDVPGFEADDLIATLTKKAVKDAMNVIIVSSDKDILSLVGDHVKVLNEPRQILYDAKKVEEDWGVTPAQMPDVLSLMGDSSDNVPGVEGLAKKRQSS